MPSISNEIQISRVLDLCFIQRHIMAQTESQSTLNMGIWRNTSYTIVKVQTNAFLYPELAIKLGNKQTDVSVICQARQKKK